MLFLFLFYIISVKFLRPDPKPTEYNGNLFYWLQEAFDHTYRAWMALANYTATFREVDINYLNWSINYLSVHFTEPAQITLRTVSVHCELALQSKLNHLRSEFPALIKWPEGLKTFLFPAHLYK